MVKTATLQRSTLAPIWFVGALLPLVASQLIRPIQHDPAYWIFWDYAGRLGALAVLCVIPSARGIAFERQALQIPLWHTALWIVGLCAADLVLQRLAFTKIAAMFPAAGVYPRLVGPLHWFDTVLGLALVAYSEELIFRRCGRDALATLMGDGPVMVVTSSLLFGLYHWWRGFGGVINATIMGVLFMLFFLRTKALWPVVVAHYLADVLYFA
jgi:uncharacterized protein